MYRMTLFFDAADLERAVEVADQVAHLCDREVGRPATDDSNVPYILVMEVEPDENDEAAKQRWFLENVMTGQARAVIIPRPIGEIN